MAVEFFDHTADIGARVIARSVDALFADAALALTTTLIDPSSVESRLNRDVALQAKDFGQLLVDWLSELVGWFDIDQFLARSAELRIREQGAEWALEATVHGETLDATRHQIKVLVKGVTYHDLQVEQTLDDEWQATVVFDI